MAAYQLTKGSVQVDVFEASDSVGGLARTIELWRQKVDIGPHASSVVTSGSTDFGLKSWAAIIVWSIASLGSFIEGVSFTTP